MVLLATALVVALVGALMGGSPKGGTSPAWAANGNACVVECANQLKECLRERIFTAQECVCENLFCLHNECELIGSPEPPGVCDLVEPD